MVAASSGLHLTAGIELSAVLGTVSPPTLELLVVDAEFVPPGAIDALMSVCPKVKVVVATDTIDEVLLASALRLPRLLGFVGRTGGNARPWEIGYLVRRLVAPHEAVPGTHQLLSWGASSMTFQPRTTRDRDLVVRAIDMVAFRFGASEKDAAIAAAASLELLNNAMIEAPIEDDGQRRYNPDRKVALLDHEIPTLRLTVDSCHVALDITDPFGRMERNTLFGRLLYPEETAGLTKLYRSGAILRVEVLPGRQTMVSWVLDRGRPAVAVPVALLPGRTLIAPGSPAVLPSFQLQLLGGTSWPKDGHAHRHRTNNLRSCRSRRPRASSTRAEADRCRTAPSSRASSAPTSPGCRSRPAPISEGSMRAPPRPARERPSPPTSRRSARSPTKPLTTCSAPAPGPAAPGSPPPASPPSSRPTPRPRRSSPAPALRCSTQRPPRSPATGRPGLRSSSSTRPPRATGSATSTRGVA